MNADFLGKGYRFPFSLKQGKLQFNEGADSIKESISLILSTAPGERVMRPAFGCGIQNYVFSGSDAGTAREIEQAVQKALLNFEPRIDVNSVKVYPDEANSSVLNIDIDYTIKYYNARDNLVYPFYLEKG